jgi:hypothetical protein
MAIVANASDVIGTSRTSYASGVPYINQSIVLAMRGCGSIPVPRLPTDAFSLANMAGFFAIPATEREHVIFARSPTARDSARTMGMIYETFRGDPWNSSNPSIVVTRENEDFLMYAYAELVAKHWGDLGLAIDALFEGAILFAEDNILRAICGMFGVTTAVADTMMLPAQRLEEIGVARIIEHNTSTIFGRSAITVAPIMRARA